MEYDATVDVDFVLSHGGATGQFTCGNKKCKLDEDLRSWEVNFSYEEHGEKKNALVKLSTSNYVRQTKYIKLRQTTYVKLSTLNYVH